MRGYGILEGFKRSLFMMYLSQVYAWKGFFVYRLQSAIWLLYAVSYTVFSIATITVIYNVSSGIAGWSYYQMLILASVSTIAVSSIWYLISPWNLVDMMRNGKIDMTLSRPFGLVTLLLSVNGFTPQISSMLSSVLIIAFSLQYVHVSLASLLAFVALFLAGLVAAVMFVAFTTVLSYMLLRSARFANNIVNIMGSASGYPLSIFGLVGSMVFTVLLPIGLATYYPAQVLFSKVTDPLAVLACLSFSALAAVVFYKGTYWLFKGYTSGGG